MTFVSVLRFAAARFSPRRYPLLVALTSTFGTVGNLVATLPLEQLLTHVGWAPTFAMAGALSLVSAVLVWRLLDDPTVPAYRMRHVRDLHAGARSVTRRLGVALSSPGTRLGFWVHFSAMCTATTLSVLWGHPYLVDGVGFSSADASVLLLVAVFVAGVGGLVVGWFLGRHARLRVGMVVIVCLLTVAAWSWSSSPSATTRRWPSSRHCSCSPCSVVRPRPCRSRSHATTTRSASSAPPPAW